MVVSCLLLILSKLWLSASDVSVGTRSRQPTSGLSRVERGQLEGSGRSDDRRAASRAGLPDF